MNDIHCMVCGKLFTGQQPLDEWEDFPGQQVGQYLCPACQKARARRARARENRKARESALRDHGMVKVRGALGGTYWE
jgi:hypothetical protein